MALGSGDSIATALKKARERDGSPTTLEEATPPVDPENPEGLSTASPQSGKEYVTPVHQALARSRVREGLLPDGRGDPAEFAKRRADRLATDEATGFIRTTLNGNLDISDVEKLRKLANVTLSLYGSEDKQAVDLANALVSRYPDELKQIYPEIGADLGDFYDPPKEGRLSGILGKVGVATKLLDYTLSGTVGLISDFAGSGGAGLSGLPERLTTFDQAKLNVDRGYDITGDGYVSYRDILVKTFNIDPSFGGPGVNIPLPLFGNRRLDQFGASDFILSIVLDPLTWATFGFGDIAKGAATTLSSFSDDGARIAAKVAYKGGGALNEAEKATARDILTVAAKRTKFVEEGGERLTNQTRRILTDLFIDNGDKEAGRIADLLEKGLIDELTPADITIIGEKLKPVYLDKLASINQAINDPAVIKGVESLVDKQIKAINNARHIKIAGKAIPGTDKLNPKIISKKIPFKPAKPVGAIIDIDTGKVVRSVTEDAADILKDLPLNQEYKTLSALEEEAFKEVDSAFKAGKTIINGALIDQETFAYVIREGLARRLFKRIPVISKLADLNIRPRDAIRRTHGGLVAENVGRATSIERATYDRLQEDFVNNLAYPLSLAAVEMGGKDAVNSTVMSYVSKSHAARQVVLEELEKAGNNATAQALKAVDAALYTIREHSFRAGAPANLLRPLDDYFPRVLSEEGAKLVADAAAGNAPHAVEALTSLGHLSATGDLLDASVETFSEGFLNRRTVLPAEQNIGTVNDYLGKFFSKAGVSISQFYEEDALVALAERARSAFAHSARAQMLNKLEHSLYDELGNKLLLKATKKSDYLFVGRKAASQGMVPLFTEGNNLVPVRYWAHPQIAKELRQVEAIMFNDTGSKALSKMLNNWSTMWATTVTVPLLNGGGYHARNAYSNVMLSFLGGLRNPARFVEAMGLQRKLRNIARVMREGGLSFEDAVDGMIENKLLSNREASILDRAVGDGVLSTGFIGDLRNEANRNIGLNKGFWARQRTLSGNFIISTGRDMGAAIENNARLGLYLDQLAKGATFGNAKAHVAKYLFDYGDITPFEERLKMVSRFYTFQRKNFGVHLSALVSTPGRVVNSQKITAAWLHLLGGDEDTSYDSRKIPGYLPPNTALRGGNLLGLNTGLADFADTLDASLAFLSIIPGGRVLLPNALLPDSTLEAFQKVTDLVSGGPIGGLQYVIEGATGHNTFTGGPVRNTGYEGLLRFTDIFIPLLSSTTREAKYLAQTFGAEDPNEEVSGVDGASLRALSWILGLSTYDVTSDTEGKVLSSLLAETNDRIKELRSNGIDIPSVSDLRDAGVIGRINTALKLVHDGDVQGAIDALPSKVADAFGLVPTVNDGEVDQLKYLFDADQALIEVQLAIGRDLTDEEKALLLLSLPGVASYSEWESLGFEPGRVNQFFRKGSGGAPDDFLDRVLGAAEVLGVSPEKAREFRPLLTDAERLLRDAQEAGLPESELRAAVLDELSKRETAWIFGNDSIAKVVDRTVTDEDLEKIQEKAWEKESLLRLVDKVFFGTEPTADEVSKFTLWNILNKGEQKDVGIEVAPVVPRAKDSRSGDQKLLDAFKKLNAGQSPEPRGSKASLSPAQPESLQSG